MIKKNISLISITIFLFISSITGCAENKPKPTVVQEDTDQTKTTFVYKYSDLDKFFYLTTKNSSTDEAINTVKKVLNSMGYEVSKESKHTLETDKYGKKHYHIQYKSTTEHRGWAAVSPPPNHLNDISLISFTKSFSASDSDPPHVLTIYTSVYSGDYVDGKKTIIRFSSTSDPATSKGKIISTLMKTELQVEAALK